MKELEKLYLKKQAALKRLQREIAELENSEQLKRQRDLLQELAKLQEKYQTTPEEIATLLGLQAAPKRPQRYWLNPLADTPQERVFSSANPARSRQMVAIKQALSGHTDFEGFRQAWLEAKDEEGSPVHPDKAERVNAFFASNPVARQTAQALWRGN